MDTKLNVIVLAAGKGTRMYSDKPKVLHALAGRALLEHSLDTARELQCSALHVVVGHGEEEIRRALSDTDVHYIRQDRQLGTGHAVQQALEYLDDDAVALVLYGDVPLITRETLEPLLEEAGDALALLTCHMEDPTGLGRIIRDEAGGVRAIVEEKDASDEQRTIREVNTGIMALPVRRLRRWLDRIGNDNAQGEYYLTDLVALAAEDGCTIRAAVCGDPLEVAGVNDRAQLAQLERHYQRRLAHRLMLSGVTLADPARLDIRGIVDIAPDVEIDVNVVLSGHVKIEKGARIGPNCLLTDCSVAAGSEIKANSVVEGAIIGRRCSIGPFARIRSGTELYDQSKIGNFVETKNAVIGPESKVNHLSYVGDTELGEAVNIGAGTITCNYDGKNKHRTEIGDDVFVGSNTALVAPVRIAAGATIAAGSTITRDVEPNDLAIARSRQTNKRGWKRPDKRDSNKE